MRLARADYYEKVKQSKGTPKKEDDSKLEPPSTNPFVGIDTNQ